MAYRALFVNVVKFLNLLTIVPPSSATAERSFSCLSRIKTWLRNSMFQERLNSVTRYFMHIGIYIGPQLDVVFEEFVGLNDYTDVLYLVTANFKIGEIELHVQFLKIYNIKFFYLNLTH